MEKKKKKVDRIIRKKFDAEMVMEFIQERCPGKKVRFGQCSCERDGDFLVQTFIVGDNEEHWDISFKDDDSKKIVGVCIFPHDDEKKCVYEVTDNFCYPPLSHLYENLEDADAAFCGARSKATGTWHVTEFDDEEFYDSYTDGYVLKVADYHNGASYCTVKLVKRVVY